MSGIQASAVLAGIGALLPAFVRLLNSIPNLPADDRPWPSWLVPACWGAFGAHVIAAVIAAGSAYRPLRSAGRVSISLLFAAVVVRMTPIAIVIYMFVEFGLYLVTALYTLVVLRIGITVGRVACNAVHHLGFLASLSCLVNWI